MSTVGEQFVAHVLKLKSDIRQSVDEHVNRFRQQTGITPSEIEISMLEVTVHRDRVKQFAVSDVKLRIGEM